MPISFDHVRKIGLGFPDVEERSSYGTPALKVKGKLFVCLRKDGESIVLKMPFILREGLLADDPETFFLTDYYLKYEWVLVRLSKLRVDALPELLKIAYRTALPVKRARKRL